MTTVGQVQHRWPVQLDFRKDELLYAIGTLAYNEAEAAQLPDETKHKVKDVQEDGNVDRIVKVIDLAFAQCVEALYPQTKECIEPITWIGNEANPNGVWTLPAYAPCDMSITTVRALKEHINEYLTARAMEDWMGVWVPAAARKYAEKAEVMMGEIHEAINRRVRRVRRTLSTF